MLPVILNSLAKEAAMTWIVSRMKWIMILSGVLTATMIQAAFSPAATVQTTFGETVNGPAAEIIVRNWGVLIALIGAMLIYGAIDLASRPLVLIVAGISKAVFIALILSRGSRYLAYQAGVAVAIDSVMIILFLWYLLAVRGSLKRPEPGLANRAKA
jgi:hypothetical protein